ncbi:MAG: BlaI/MecI/CopY family transcriptional regulator [Fuerstiella sp.]
MPEGKLTANQFEIMQLIWSSAAGLSVVEIWELICKVRNVSRTTVLNLVDRLEKRGWLERHKHNKIYRYVSRVEQQAAEQQLAADFVEEFFQGSAANLVMNLLGSEQLSTKEVQQLKSLISDVSTPASRTGEKQQ